MSKTVWRFRPPGRSEIIGSVAVLLLTAAFWVYVLADEPIQIQRRGSAKNPRGPALSAFRVEEWVPSPSHGLIDASAAKEISDQELQARIESYERSLKARSEVPTPQPQTEGH